MTFEEFVKKYNIIDPYSNIYPDTKYDYVSAWKAGATPDSTGHWPSEFKHEDSPERYINGIDTKNLKGDSMPNNVEEYMNVESEKFDGSGDEFPNKDAQENSNILIQADDNKDFYELLDKITRFTPLGVGRNIRDISGEFEGQRGSFLDQLSALRGGGEEDPVGPQGLPFSDYMKIRPYLQEMQQQPVDKQKVRSIAEVHAKKLTQPK